MEISKLAAETEEIERRLAAKPSFWNKSRDSIIYLTALVTLGAGGFGIFNEVGTYLSQRQREIEQAEKAYEFNINQEIILLSRQLASPIEIERNNAALLLSGFEENALPILVENLRLTDKGSLPQKLTNSLDLILRKKKSDDLKKQKQRTERILTFVAREAEAFFDTQYSGDDYDLLAMKNYIVAMGRLGARAPGTIGPVLARMREKLTDRKSRIVNGDRETLESWISNASSQVAQP